MLRCIVLFSAVICCRCYRSFPTEPVQLFQFHLAVSRAFQIATLLPFQLNAGFRMLLGSAVGSWSSIFTHPSPTLLSSFLISSFLLPSPIPEPKVGTMPSPPLPSSRKTTTPVPPPSWQEAAPGDRGRGFGAVRAFQGQQAERNLRAWKGGHG